MSEKFQNRYLIPSVRAPWWDYSQNGLYFITICTANRKTILGNIENKNHGIAVRVPKSISSFVAGFKSAATVRINQYRQTPGKPVWQTRFHDHIIRDDESYHRIWHYIKNNPAKWNEDTFFKE